MGLSGRQPGKGMGVSVGPQEAALPPSPQTGSWGPPSTPPDLGTPGLVCACWGLRKCVGGRGGDYRCQEGREGEVQGEEV